MKNKIISAKYMNKSDLNKLSKAKLIQLILTKYAQKKEKNTISSNSMTLKQLSKYLPDAKKLGYNWNQLMKKSTGGAIMNDIQRYRNIESVHAIIPKAIRDSQKYLELDRKLKQKERLIKRNHERLIRRQKQTADVLIFQRFNNKDEIPQGRKIAFKDENGFYILKLRRYFIIDKINGAEKYIERRIYDNNHHEFDKVVKILKTSEDFNELYKNHQSYVSCIVIKTLTDVGDETQANDILDDDLFMSRDEHGVFSRYYIDFNKRARDVKDNSCFVNIIINRFQKAFIKARNNNSYKFELTRETLCDLCGIEYKDENIGLSINKSLAFFKKFKLGLHIFGPFGTIYKYKPDKRNKNLNPAYLFIYILNNHCYEINRNIKEFEQLHWTAPIDDNLSNELNLLTVSKQYIIRQQSIMKDSPCFVNSINEAIDFIQSYNTVCDDLHIVKIIYNDYLDKLLFEIINAFGYTPEIKMTGGKITALLVKYNNTLFNITLTDTKANDTDVWIEKDNLELYNTIDDAFYNGLICQEHISTYNKGTINIESLLPMGPKSGYFSEHTSKPLMGIDSRKAYASDFMSIEYLPVFGHFEKKQQYDLHWHFKTNMIKPHHNKFVFLHLGQIYLKNSPVTNINKINIIFIQFTSFAFFSFKQSN